VRLLRPTVVFVLVTLVLACLGPLSAQETVELRNWSAPPFLSLPKPEKAEADGPPDVGLYSAEGTEGNAPPQVLPLQTIPPCRIADTRGNGFSGQAGPPALNTGPRVFQISGSVAGVPLPCGIPLTARAVSFQFTIVTPNSAGNLIAWPSGPAPTISVLNWSAGETALGNGTVVPLSASGTLSVQINAAVGGATGHLVLDVNGYYGPSIDDFFVHHEEASSVSSFMITDGTIVNADVNASAAIADTKLATIATAGKVADSALSSNVTKLGQTIEAGEITNVLRSISIPLLSFMDCSAIPGFLDFTNGTDAIPNFLGLPNGGGVEISFDSVSGRPDQGSPICAQVTIPPDYEAGGSLRVRAGKVTNNNPPETLTCTAHVNNGSAQAAGTVDVAIAANQSYVCTPTLVGIAPGAVVSFALSVTSSGTMNDTVIVHAVAFEYTATQ
jgi:hypothetical protein